MSEVKSTDITDEMVQAFVMTSSIAPGDNTDRIKHGIAAALSHSPVEQQPVAWRWVWKTTGSELEQRFADPDLYEWTYRHTPPSGEAAEKMIVEPLYDRPATTEASPVEQESGTGADGAKKILLPSDSMVMAACRAHTPQFDRLDEEIARYAKDQMREALTAALKIMEISR